jgi:hypothetical protein
LGVKGHRPRLYRAQRRASPVRSGWPASRPARSAPGAGQWQTGRSCRR